MKRVAQEEYNKVISAIEKSSCFRFSAGDDKSGAFLVPVDCEGKAMGVPEYFSWDKLKGFAEVLKEKPQLGFGRAD